MIPILYGPEETAFSTNGIGRLSDCLSCKVTQEQNGVYECEFAYPITGEHYADIKEGCIVLVRHDDTTDRQPFDIYGRSAPLNGVVTFYAHHISYRLANIVVMPFSATSVPNVLAGLKTHSLTNNPFTFWTDRTTTGTFTVSVPSPLRSLLGGQRGSILDVYGVGDYVFDRWTVKLYGHYSTDSGVEIRYGKNLTDLKQDITYEGTYSAAMAYWASDDGSEVVTLPSLVYADQMLTRETTWTTESDEDVTDEHGDPIELRYAIVTPTTMDLSGAFDERPTVEELAEAAQKRLNNSKAWVPDENVTVNFVALWQTEEYKDVAPLQRVGLGDTVSVIYTALGIQKMKQRVVKVVYDVLLERYDSMELGKTRTTIADVVKADVANEMSQLPTRTYMAAAIDAATALITGGLGGHVIMNMDAGTGKPSEILIMDTEDIETAVNVLRINLNGIGFSSNGYNGPFETAWTLDGHFNASFIDTGTMTANLIRAGVIRSLEGENYWDLNSDEMVLKKVKIRIVTDEGSYDLIEMLGNSGQWKHKITPLEDVFTNIERQKTIQIQAGGVFGYKYATLEEGVDIDAYRSLTLTNDGYLYLGGAGASGFLAVRDSNGKNRFTQFGGVSTWYDADGNTLATLTDAGALTVQSINLPSAGSGILIGGAGYTGWAFRAVKDTGGNTIMVPCHPV